MVNSYRVAERCQCIDPLQTFVAQYYKAGANQLQQPAVTHVGAQSDLFVRYLADTIVG